MIIKTIGWVCGNGKFVTNNKSSRIYTFIKFNKNGEYKDGFFDTDVDGKNFYKENPNFRDKGYRRIK